MNKPVMSKENVDVLYDAKYLKLYDLRYSQGKHYFSASRCNTENLVAIKSDDEFKAMLPDAVTIAVVLHLPKQNPKLLLSYEYRYPVGRFLLSPIAGLLDPEDREDENPLCSAAVREIYEETGIKVAKTDKITVLNPCAYSTPGMTDESNAFLCADITLADTSMLDQSGCVGTELFDGFEFVDVDEAAKIYKSGRDKNGNTFSLATWAVLGWFIMQYGE
ncbi:MAG: NUDIX hydrolase [Lachnospiraceae bacterium]|nr:NUDIX hydrolase [Lachnospiraceae bacterium]